MNNYDNSIGVVETKHSRGGDAVQNEFDIPSNKIQIKLSKRTKSSTITNQNVITNTYSTFLAMARNFL